jgi:hypothetical protein
MGAIAIACQFMNGGDSREWHGSIKVRKQITTARGFVNEGWPKSLPIHRKE